MLDQLISLDKELMVQLNLSGQHTPFGDTTMWMTSQMLMWLPFYAALLYATIKDFKKESLAVILCAGLTILLCDQISSGLLKPLVGRLRPSHDPSIMDQLSFIGSFRAGKYGFPSSHASNCFGLALLFSLLLRNKAATFCLFTWASLCAYSRIYLGVHYPGDITVGMIIGLICGWSCYKLLVYLKENRKANMSKNSKYSPSSGTIIAWTITGTICCIVCFGSQASRLFE